MGRRFVNSTSVGETKLLHMNDSNFAIRRNLETCIPIKDGDEKTIEDRLFSQKY